MRLYQKAATVTEPFNACAGATFVSATGMEKPSAPAAKIARMKILTNNPTTHGPH